MHSYLQVKSKTRQSPKTYSSFFIFKRWITPNTIAQFKCLALLDSQFINTYNVKCFVFWKAHVQNLPTSVQNATRISSWPHVIGGYETRDGRGMILLVSGSQRSENSPRRYKYYRVAWENLRSNHLVFVTFY